MFGSSEKTRIHLRGIYISEELEGCKVKRQTDNHVNIWKGLAAGLLGGVAASWTMNASQSAMSEIRKRRAKAQHSTGQTNSNQQQPSTEDPATVKAARAISKQVFHHELRDDEKSLAGNATHYAMGSGSGAIYGATAEVLPAATLGRGILFGAALWLIADEGIVPALGLSKAPVEYPASMHGYALASHLVYGVTADAVRRFLLRLF
jgi:uncharacterized membrane protein YagU involved in acid resistance